MLTYEKRADYCHNPTANRLLKLMTEKESNLAVSLDVIDSASLLAMADQLGPQICILKTHIDIVEDVSQEVIQTLAEMAHKHNFIIFEDRKFADIGHTVKLQYGKGLYHIANWAAITNAHPLPGPGIIEGLKQVGLPLGNGLLLIAQMSSQGNLANEAYTAHTLAMAQAHEDFVIGFITQHKLTDAPHLINMTPGVQLESHQDDLGQRYITPEVALIEHDTDIIIVGRGILQADDPLEAAKTYRQRGWQAYQDKLKT